jgi:hypothetical protein
MDFFEAELETPITKPSVTHKILNRIIIEYDAQKTGTTLEKVTVHVFLDYWNKDAKPFIVQSEVEVLTEAGDEFWAGNVSNAADLKSITHDRLVAIGEIAPGDIWTLQ